MLAVLSGSSALILQPSQHVHLQPARCSLKMQFNMPKLPNPFGGSDDEQEKPAGDKFERGFGGFVAPPRPDRPEFKLEVPNPFAQEIKLGPRDVVFTDKDGDEVVLQPNAGGTVDFWVGNKLVLEKARLERNGDSLEITGTIKKGTPLSMLGFNLEEIATEGTTPRDPDDVDKAMALVGQ